MAGGTGWIDGSALCILDQAGLDRSVAIDILRHDRELDFSFGGDEGDDLFGGVHWDEGVIRGYVESRESDNLFRLEAEVLMLKVSRLPAVFIPGLMGRRLGEVIETQYIPDNALIVGVEESGDWLYLTLEISRSVIEEALRV